MERLVRFHLPDAIADTHVIEHDGHLLIAFAGGKRSVEILKVKISDLEKISN